MSIYNKNIIKFLSFEGFNEKFESNMRLCSTYKKAYLKTETEFKKVFGEQKYASYDSFRMVRSRKIKKKALK
jgi:hypothetical protein